MEINSKKLDELYKEWSGEHHTTNSNKQVHDSSECTDFAEYCLKLAVSEGEMIPTRDSNCNIPLVIKSVCDDCTAYPFDERGKTPLCKTCKYNPSQTVL